jgi:hypothetical protein
LVAFKASSSADAGPATDNGDESIMVVAEVVSNDA